MSEPTKREKTEAQKVVMPYRQQINSTPPLMSLLYDIDLMPEQIVRHVNAVRMVAVCEMFKRLTPEAVEDLLKGPPK